MPSIESLIRILIFGIILVIVWYVVVLLLGLLGLPAIVGTLTAVVLSLIFLFRVLQELDIKI